jgi:hypothetical protein
MNNFPDDKKKTSDDGADHSVNSDPKQGKSDPQLTELDGLKKGGKQPTVNPADRARDEKGKMD